MINLDREFIEQNMNLVYYIIHKYYPAFSKDEDVIQSGMLGLCKASLHYDERKGKFSTYAGATIKNEIVNELKGKSNAFSLDELMEHGSELV